MYTARGEGRDAAGPAARAARRVKAGVLSDTHGHAARTRAAAAALAAAGVDVVLHAGDVGSGAVLAELAAVFGPLGVPVEVVPGNMDRFAEDVAGFPAEAGVRVHRAGVFRTVLGGRSVALLHGDDAGALRRALASCDVVFSGHSHVRHDGREGAARWINPGAVYRTAEPSVAVFDLARGRCRFLRMDPASGVFCGRPPGAP